MSLKPLVARLFGAVLAIAALQAHAQGLGPAYVDSTLHLQFPARLGELVFQKTVQYPKKELGYCVVYEGKGSLGQFCVFDFGHPKLTAGTGSQEFKEALRIAEEGTIRATNTPPFRKGQLIGGGPVTIEGEGGKAEAEVRLFTSEMGPEEAPVRSEHLILMTTGLGKFLKLNYTATNLNADQFAEESRQLVKAFIEANGEVLKMVLLPATK